MIPDLSAGRCHTVDAEVMHPSRPEDTRIAKAVCWRCPVLDACREHALVTAEPYGVWGGLSETDRRRIREQRGIPSRAQQRSAEVRDEIRRLHALGTPKTVIARRLDIGLTQVWHCLTHPAAPAAPAANSTREAA
jgi:hypothetical protein